MVRYEVNRQGEVRHIRRKQVLKPLDYGYTHGSLVAFRYQGKMNYVHIYSLVAKAFVDGYDPAKVVNHINGNRFDNRAENLEWVTPSENVRHETLLNSRPIRIHTDEGNTMCFLNKREAQRWGYSKYYRRKSGKHWEHISHRDFWQSVTITHDFLISDMMIDAFNKYYKFFLDNNLFRHE